MAANYTHLIDIIFQAKNAGATQAEIAKVFSTLDKGKKPVEDAAKKMGDFEKALRRVAVVAPVWMVARGAMMAFLRGFSEGFKYLEEFDSAMIKAQAVTHGVTGNMGDAMDDLRGRIRNLSQETGESMTKIAAAFYQFGTIGMSFEKSWQGAEAATRFALATQEDSAKVAKTLAMTFRILGDTIDETIPPQQAMEVELAKMYKLWQVNAGEAGDLTASLAAFLPTANTMNLSMDETIALLSTLNSAAMLGSRGGTLLRTSFSKLIDNSDKLASSLGIYVNPQLDTTFNVMMKVLGAIKQLSEGQNFPTAAQDIISQIFGGVRGGEPVKALVAMYDQLQENISITTKGYQDQSGILSEYRKRQEEVIDSVSGQMKIFRELRTQMFEQFITGVTGADDYAKSLKQINIMLDELSSRALIAGEKIAEVFKLIAHPDLEIKRQLSDIDKEISSFWDEIEKGLAGKLSVTKTIELAASIQTKYPKENYMLYIADALVDKAAELVKVKTQQERIEKTITDWSAEHITKKQEEIKTYENLLRQIDLQKKDIQEQLGLQKMINEGYSESDIIIAKISNEVSKIVEQYNSLDSVQNKTVPQLNRQELLTAVLSENWSKVLQLTNQQPFVQEKILGLAKQVNETELEKNKILQDQQDKYRDIYVEYEKADAFERARLRRILELQKMTPEELGTTYKNTAYDKNIILNEMNRFRKDQQYAITEQIGKERGLEEFTAKHPDEILMDILSKLGAGTVGARTSEAKQNITPITNITNKGAEQIYIEYHEPGVTPEEMADIIKKELLTNEDFQQIFGRKISGKI